MWTDHNTAGKRTCVPGWDGSVYSAWGAPVFDFSTIVFDLKQFFKNRRQSFDVTFIYEHSCNIGAKSIEIWRSYMFSPEVMSVKCEPGSRENPPKTARKWYISYLLNTHTWSQGSIEAVQIMYMFCTCIIVVVQQHLTRISYRKLGWYTWEVGGAHAKMCWCAWVSSVGVNEGVWLLFIARSVSNLVYVCMLMSLNILTTLVCILRSSNETFPLKYIRHSIWDAEKFTETKSCIQTLL